MTKHRMVWRSWLRTFSASRVLYMARFAHQVLEPPAMLHSGEDEPPEPDGNEDERSRGRGMVAREAHAAVHERRFFGVKQRSWVEGACGLSTYLTNKLWVGRDDGRGVRFGCLSYITASGTTSWRIGASSFEVRVKAWCQLRCGVNVWHALNTVP